MLTYSQCSLAYHMVWLYDSYIILYIAMHCLRCEVYNSCSMHKLYYMFLLTAYPELYAPYSLRSLLYAPYPVLCTSVITLYAVFSIRFSIINIIRVMLCALQCIAQSLYSICSLFSAVLHFYIILWCDMSGCNFGKVDSRR